MTAPEVLAQLLDNLAAADRRTPCQDPDDGWAWLSDSAEDRADAARRCAPCTLRLPCLAAAIEQDDRTTARGGHDLHTASGRHAARAELDPLPRQEHTA